jgi:hypothetical protein
MRPARTHLCNACLLLCTGSIPHDVIQHRSAKGRLAGWRPSRIVTNVAVLLLGARSLDIESAHIDPAMSPTR